MLQHALLDEYLPFMVLLFSLYVISGVITGTYTLSPTLEGYSFDPVTRTEEAIGDSRLVLLTDAETTIGHFLNGPKAIWAFWSASTASSVSASSTLATTMLDSIASIYWLFG